MPAYSQLFAVGDTAFQAAGAIGGADEFLRVFLVPDFVVDF